MKTLEWMLGVLVTASCGYPRPADVGADDAPGDGPGSTNCQLTAIEPSIANTDDTITIEGTFIDVVTVNFPGGTSVAATVLGPHRAMATVPALATEGDLTVTTCGSTLGPLPFRRASFVTGLGMFEAGFEQAEGARQNVRLVAARDSHTSAVVGHYLYVIGGAESNVSLNSVERVGINADGSLGPFAAVPGINLVTARQAHTTVVLGNYLYVIGGIGNGSPLNSIERTIIASDGSLGPFATVSDVTLTTARHGHTTAVVGNYLYILGGFGSNSLNSVERAIINADGSLGPFATVPGITLATARHGHTTAVVGNYLYVLGGARGNGSLQDIERATINSDGSLGPFASVSGATLMTARSGHTTTVFGNYLYVIGGVASNSSLNSIERAPLDAVGSLGSFTTVSGVTLTTARHGHTTAVIGNYIYVFGGVGSGSLNNVERTTINASGSLAPFATVSDVTLATARSGHTTAVVGHYLYVLGGLGNGPLNSVERATINADSSLGPFTTVGDVILTTTRHAHTTAVIGNYLYIVGGVGTAFTPTNSVERATINASGSLAPFATVPGVTLATARHSHTTAVAGNFLYVLGGVDASFTPLDSIERATINADGSLGAFAILSGVKLTTTRCAHTTAVIGNHLYVLGGATCASVSNDPPLNSVERATINADGSLEPFATVSGVTLSTGRESHTASVVGSYLYLLGGRGSAGLNSIERATINADGSLGLFATVTGVTLTTGRYAHTAAVIGNYLYILGGAITSGRNIIEQAILNADGSLAPLATRAAPLR